MQKQNYQVVFSGEIDQRWSDWFEGLQICYDRQTNQTTLEGPLTDQAALYGLLNKLRDLNLVLLKVVRLPAS